MGHDDNDDDNDLARAREAADQCFQGKPYGQEPRSRAAAAAAVDRLGMLLGALPGSIRTALDAARRSAELLSGDRLQGLQESAQNANDLGASEVRFALSENGLLVAHNGARVRLDDVNAMATPWLTTKIADAGADGRFGIGLMTLRALSPTFDVHCDPYHFRVGAPILDAIDPWEPPTGLAETGWTVLRVPVAPDLVSEAELAAWFEAWDDPALLFLRHVRRVTFLSAGDDNSVELSLTWEAGGSRRLGPFEVECRTAHARDGRTWAVYTTGAPAPAGLARAGDKATGPTTPLGVAIALHDDQSGMLHAGLPVCRGVAPLRANAQFDPLTNRRDLATGPWNEALAGLVADLWTEAMVDLFATAPTAAWRAVPLVGPDDRTSVSGLLGGLLLERARRDLAARLVFPVPGGGEVPLAELAVETPRLEGVLTTDEIAALADLKAVLPAGVRDDEGHFRTVLDDWREAGASLSEPVMVETALRLLPDEHRSPEATIALAAAGIDAGHGEALGRLAWVVTEGGQRVAPPGPGSASVLVAGPAPFAEALGLAVRLHLAHLRGTDDARAVLKFLADRDALVDTADAGAVLRRLAVLGRTGRALLPVLSDVQLRALREAFETLPIQERNTLAADVGRAVHLDGYRYEAGRRRRAVKVRPADAYLPRTVDRDQNSFAQAAGEAPGPVWLDARYATVLRSPSGRAGMGALRFLRLLGAETAPRVRPHPRAVTRYSTGQPGVPAGVGPEVRDRALEAHGATYTVADHDSPDLLAVVADIARDRSAKRRRQRAGALLGCLGRAWDRLGEFAEVTAAYDYMSWQERGRVAGFWIFQAGDVAWLDDVSGQRRRPTELRLYSPGTVALHGPKASGYLHRDLDDPQRRAVLHALGVTGEPGTAALVDHLRSLRETGREVTADTAVVYQALGERLRRGGRSPGGMSVERLRASFSEGAGLVYTAAGWRAPGAVFSGPPVFGPRRAFVPAIVGADVLWKALRIGPPDAEECVRVLSELARTQYPPDEVGQAVILDTLRLLVARLGAMIPSRKLAGRLRRLGLWTTAGWVRTRPIYAVDDPTLEAALGPHVPIWRPGGEIGQFRPLLGPLGVVELRAASATVVDRDGAEESDEGTELVRTAMPLLRDDLVRNEPILAAGVVWEPLESLQVFVHPELSVRLPGVPAEVAVGAAVDAGILYVRDPALVARVEGGGRAVAGAWGRDRRRIAQAWLAACDEARAGRQAATLVLAAERAREEAARNQAAIKARAVALQKRTAERPGPATRPNGHAGRGAPGNTTSTNGSSGGGKGDIRVLVDLDSLELLDPAGRVVTGTKGKPARKRHNGALPDPKPNGASPKSRARRPAYTDLDKETLGLELVRWVLASDIPEIVDLRAQHGVGADAIDQLARFYELKVHAGAEPDRITLEGAQIRRAHTTRDFFVVVVSQLEGPSATPQLRFIVDPLSQLEPVPTSATSFSGVRSAEGVLYQFRYQASSQEAPDPSHTTSR